MQELATIVLGSVNDMSDTTWRIAKITIRMFLMGLLVTIGQLLKMEEVATAISQPISRGLMTLAQEVWASQRESVFPNLVESALIGFTDSEWEKAKAIMENSPVELFFSQPERDKSLHIFALLVPDLEAIREMNPGAADCLPFLTIHRQVTVHTLEPDELRFGNFHGAVTVALKDESEEAQQGQKE
jgi:hypothetical protein